MNETLKPNPAGSGLASDANDDDGALALPTDAPPELRQLRDRQIRVLTAIMAGKGYTQAAAVGGVARRTVYNWAKKDEAFKSAMSAWRARMEMHATDELTCAIAAAARIFGRAAATDWHAAAVLLRERGVLAAGAGRTANVQTSAGAQRGTLLAQLAALPLASRREIEKRIADLLAGKEPEYMSELRALQKRMIAEEAATAQAPVKSLAELKAEAAKARKAARLAEPCDPVPLYELP